MTERDRWDVAVWITCGMLIFLVLALAGTGLWLTANYHPSSPGLRGFEVSRTIDQARRMRDVHAALSRLAIGAAGAVLVAVIGRSVQRRGRAKVLVPTAALLALATLAASFTGYLLPWDQLGLWAVTVGTNVKGVWQAAFSGDVRFVIVDHSEISPRTYQRWVLVHVVALGIVIVTLLVGILWQLRRRDEPEAEPDTLRS